MLFRSALISMASGSMAGMTASRNKGGAYLRSRVVPTNPGTEPQTAVRSYMAQLAALWNTTLTDAQRAAWTEYALNTPLINRIGDAKPISGMPMYVRCNVPRLQAGLDRVDAAPTVFGLGDFTAPGITSITGSTSVAIVTFEAADDWASEDGAALLVLGSRGQNPTINYFKGPFQYAGSVEGAASPPASPQNITIPFGLAAGQKAFLQFRVTRADGRLSASIVLPKICI